MLTYIWLTHFFPPWVNHHSQGCSWVRFFEASKSASEVKAGKTPSAKTSGWNTWDLMDYLEMWPMNTFFLGFRFEKRGDSYLPVFFLEVWTLLSVSTGDIPVDSSERPGGVRWEAISSYLMILRHQIWHVLSFQLSFFFLQIPRGICPCCFFSGGGGWKKHIFWKMARQNTHLLKKIPEILNKEESVWKVRSHNLKLFVFFWFQKEQFYNAYP